MNNPQEIAERYAALWNEPDPSRRRESVRALWTPNGAQVLVDPPREARAAADQLRFRKPSFEVHGYEALQARVTSAYEMFIAPGEVRVPVTGGFRRADPRCGRRQLGAGVDEWRRSSPRRKLVFGQRADFRVLDNT
jgi:hypothetical protein